MLRVLHTGDIHLGDLAGPTRDGENLRRLDTLACMDYIVQTAREEGPHLTIIAGDLFNRSRVWADTALDDVNDALARFIRPLCEYSDAVVLLFGTMNHDNPRAFEVIRKATGDLANFHIYTTPKVERIVTSAGPVQIVAMPGFDKARLRLFCPGVDQEAENRNATALVNDSIMGLGTQLDKSLPSVLVAHYTVSGSESENGSTFLAGQDVVVLPSTIDATGVDLACFGHIHTAQKLMSNTPAYYCGSPNQLTFNDEDSVHGFWIHDLEGEWHSEFRRTPERCHLTIRMSAEDVTQFISSGKYEIPDDARDSIVRIRYTCNTEQEKAFNRAELQRQIMAAGAFYVAEIVPEDIEDLDAKNQLTEHDGPAECLARWLESNEITGEKAVRLMELALPIIKEADDGRDDGKHTGAFVPKTILVRNYRSYTDAFFDFEPVHMAMVNGHNGVGKSSLFMDAIADCLYEQTRKEDIGGWVRDGTKSGSITFTFDMGGQTYRVVRTRTKAGRGTLALQRFDTEADGWADESDTTMKLTQAKIERLLGMDCNTFCSIALIRQDAYGLFLDADSDRRMEVLSALLGLDIYNRMNDIARNRSKEQRQKIAASKERVKMLGEQAAGKDQLRDDDMVLWEKTQELEEAIKENEASLRIVESDESLVQELTRQADEKDALAKELGRNRYDKLDNLGDLEKKVAGNRLIAEGLEAAEEATRRLEEAEREAAALAPIQEKDRELLKGLGLSRKAMEDARANVTRLERSKLQYEGITAKRGEIEAAQEALKAIGERMKDAQEKVKQSEATGKAKRDAKAAVDQHLADSRVRIGELTARLNSAQAEAGKLADSGCPNPATATCKFLTSAVAAQAAIPELSTSLETMKAEDRAKYNTLLEAYNKAKEADDALGDPMELVMEIDAERRKLQKTADLAPDLAAADAKLEEIENALADNRAVIAEKEAEIERLENERMELVQDLNKLEALTSAIAGLKPRAAGLADCKAAAAALEALTPQVEQLKAEVEDIRAKKEKAELEAHELRGRIPASFAGRADSLRALIDTKRKTITDYATQRGTIKAKLESIAEAEAQMAELRKSIEAAAAVLDDYTVLGQAFSIDGIPYMIIRGVVPEIMRQSNDILAAMTGGRMAVDIRTEREQKSTKQIVNSLEVWINTITGGNRPYQSHSGGEKVKIALAVTLGLADVKARRAGVQLGMLFIDEPPFLDGDGTEAYADALVSMGGRNPNMRILAISHDPTMKARFSQNIIVSDGENGSTVEME